MMEVGRRLCGLQSIATWMLSNICSVKVLTPEVAMMYVPNGFFNSYCHGSTLVAIVILSIHLSVRHVSVPGEIKMLGFHCFTV